MRLIPCEVPGISRLSCKCLIYLLLVLLYFTRTATAQHYSYTHYTVKDGLVGTMVYCIYQDKDGFMWFGTETGVSRFDGTHFKNFSATEGLPDNTIVQIYCDSKGRVWLVPFKNAICFYEDGEIYNQQNTPWLDKIKPYDFIRSIAENKYGELLLVDKTRLYRITTNDSVEILSSAFLSRSEQVKAAPSDSGFFYVLDAYRICKTDTRKFTYLRKTDANSTGGKHSIMSDNLFCWPLSDTAMQIYSPLFKVNYSFRVPLINTSYRINDSTICLSTVKGAIILDIKKRKVIHHFLPDKNITNYFMDREGGHWLSTFNDGVYKLNSDKFHSVLYAPGNKKWSVYELQKGKDNIMIGADIGLLTLKPEDSTHPMVLTHLIKTPVNNAVVTIKKKGDTLLVGGGNDFYITSGKNRFQRRVGSYSIKEAAFKSDSEIIVGNSFSVYTTRLPSFTASRMIWRGRTTSLLHENGVTYFGSLRGLYMVEHDSVITYLGAQDPDLCYRVAAIASGPDGMIWAATYGGGVIGLRDKKVVRKIQIEDGLPSNNCRSVTTDGRQVWIGTDRGLSKVTSGPRRSTVVTYTTADGLAADIINSVLVSGNLVYVGSPEGITYFNKRTPVAFSRCGLKLLNVQVNGKDVNKKSLLRLEYRKNNIRVDYTAISFKDAGDIRYSYRLLGLDSNWKNTYQTSLEFISLPPGHYTLELTATNKYDVKSKIVYLPIQVDTPFWQTSWFILLTTACIIFITWAVIARRNSITRKRDAAEREIEQKLQALEQKALRAQMNPHFIFNCLNAVQEFILDHDTLSANKYLGSFARLIRQTLDNSLHPLISVENEIQYLSTYLQLEQMRFKDKFDYRLYMDKNIDGAQTAIPAMMLQPYIENAIRHGIHHKDDGEGYIEITFFREGQQIVCTITDNGIGREAAQALKTAQHITYQSRGMQLTQERINMINKNGGPPIVVTVTDILTENGSINGTRVTVQFPMIPYKKQETTL